MSGFGGGPAPSLGAPGCDGCTEGKDHRYAVGGRLLDDVAPGYVRRLAPGAASNPPPDQPVDEARRNFLKLAVVGGAIALGAAGGASALRYLVPPPAGAATYPSI